MNRLLVIAFMSALPIALFACGDNNNSTPRATSETLFPPTTAGTQTSFTPQPSATAAANSTSGPNENGEAPIFWRTADNFASLTENQSYKMLLRVDNGYAEPEITVSAVCTSCRAPVALPTVTLTGTNVTPVGEEAPGSSFYPVSVLLPRAGHWELTVHAGADSVMISVDVQAAP